LALTALKNVVFGAKAAHAPCSRICDLFSFALRTSGQSVSPNAWALHGFESQMWLRAQASCLVLEGGYVLGVGGEGLPASGRFLMHFSLLWKE
jgi:hypothetical protein